MMENNPLKVHWVIKPRDVSGNSLGYMTHNQHLYDYCKNFGIEYDDEAKIAFHIVSADNFRPIAGKYNVLLTMWEFLKLPESYLKAIKNADALILPSTFCKKVFEPHFERKDRVYICREGVVPSEFPYRKRTFRGGSQRFRLLWVGASNPRKGYLSVLEAVKLCDKVPNLEIYIKTTVPKITWRQSLRQVRNRWREIAFKDGHFVGFRRLLLRLPLKMYAGRATVMGANKNVIFDTRKLTREELRDLYYSAHCFLFPTIGEGWGLTLCEAMATGCPAISISETGCADFFDARVGYPIKTNIWEQTLENYDNLKTGAYVPDTSDMINQIFNVVNDYDSAARRAKRGSDRIHAKLTWELAGKRLAEIFKEVAKDVDNACIR